MYGDRQRRPRLPGARPARRRAGRVPRPLVGAPGHHWPDRPGLVAGRDLRAGGTWLAVDPVAPRVATVLNGRGRMAPNPSASPAAACRC
ncbi:NRDE family protein [Actinomadura yumaensis]|uniref:NRDE family protein n=1 Tax=Actinomadura yumaensis TaxID=111807 RepID=UPI003614E718